MSYFNGKLLLGLVLASASALGSENASENRERNVDRVALESQEKAISKLATLLKKYRGTHQEPILLIRLAELQQQDSAILFRIAHGEAHATKKGLNLSHYKKMLGSTISTLNQMIAKYPHHTEVGRAFFIRGKSYEEAGDKGAATRDYLHLVRNYSELEEVLPAYMSLAEFSIEKADHSQAVEYLKKVEARPDCPHFPFALYKLAWAHYNLKAIPTALSYAERHIAFYNAKLAERPSQSDIALRDAMLMDSTAFFFEGYEQKLPQYALSGALEYFKKLDSSAILGKMFVRFGKLLRSHGHEYDLVAWKDEIISRESSRPESLDVLIIAYESQLNKRRYAQVAESARDLVRLYKINSKIETYDTARKLLLDTANGLQEIIVKNRGAQGVSELSTHLAAIYDSFTQVVDEADPRIPRVHYNLAETLFEIRDFDQATVHYRWIVEHQKGVPQKEIRDAGLKAIASRYEVLRTKKLIPTELTAKAGDIEDTDDIELDPKLVQWVSWIDQDSDEMTGASENFLFEANRAIYAKGRVQQAMERMIQFAKKHPASKYAIPSASLALDTYIVNTRWEQAHDLASSLYDSGRWKKSEFHGKLLTIASDSFYKLVESAHRRKDFLETLSLADRFLKSYPTSKKLADCLVLAGGAATQMAQKDRAYKYFSRLIREVPESSLLNSALLERAAMEEDRYQFGAAARDYRQYLEKKTDDDLDPIRKKALALTWLSGVEGDLRSAISSKKVCTERLYSDCDRFLALMSLETKERGSVDALLPSPIHRAKKGLKENRAIWAAVALENSADLNFHDRLVAMRYVAADWDDLDSLAKYALLPKITASIPKVFQENRMKVPSHSPLRADEKAITRRLEYIREMENLASRIIKLPWTSIRGPVLEDVALLYFELSQGLGSMAKDDPAYQEVIGKLVAPFEAKGKEIREESEKVSIRKANLTVETLEKLDTKGDWDSLDTDSNDATERLKALWIAAIEKKHWAQVAFFLQEAEEKALIEAGIIGAVKAVSLAAAGAPNEALAELDEAKSDLTPEGEAHADSLLADRKIASK